MLRKIVSLCLALVLIVSVLPQIGILSQAAPLDEGDTTADGQIETVNALNALLVGVRFAPEDYGTEVRNWPDEAICNAISGKLLWDDYLYDDSSYLSGIGLEYWTGEDWYWHFDLDLIQKITQSTLGRDFSDNAGSEYIFISGNELLLMPATGESTTLSVQSYTKQDNRIIAVGIAVYADNISSEFLGYFQAMFEENPSSIYGYTLRSLERVTSDQNFKNIKASASSELDGGASTYYAGNVLDGDLSTAWAEGVPGDGVDEWIRLETTDGSLMDVSAIQFAMGYQKNDQLLEKNSWPYEVLIEAEGGFNQTVELYWYTDMFILDQPVKTNWIKITILGVEEGSSYDDTCISEIQLYGINDASASKGYTAAEVEKLVAEYYNEYYISEENPGKYVVFSGETTVSGDFCTVVVRFQGDNATAANAFVADVSVDMTTGDMYVDGKLLEAYVKDQNERKLVIYTDHTNREVSIGSIITLGAVALSEGNPVGKADEITFQIADPSILRVIRTDDEDQYRYVKLEGMEVGTTNVAFNDSTTGNTVTVPITVYENRYLFYTLSNVPSQQIDKYTSNFYNINGLYVDSYEYTVNDDQSATVSFDVYNTNYSYGTVEVFDENGILKDAVLIDKMTSSSTGIKEAVLDNLGYLIRDIYQGDLFSYRQESGVSKMTPISVKIPKNGYIKLCMDPEKSNIVGLVNYADLLLSLLDLSGEITGFSTKSKEFSEKVTAKIVNEEIFAVIVNDADKMKQTLWKNVGQEAIITSEAMGDFVDTAIKNLSEFGLLDVVGSTAWDCGWSIGEKAFTDLAGIFGTALKVLFTVGKAENIIIQYHDITNLAGCGCIGIQNQGGGIRSCQQIRVEKEDGFNDDTALNVFSVTLEADVLDIIEKYSPEIYDKMIGGVTYTYNISLMKDGNETQPDGEVTVYIPIPDELKVLAYAGELTDGGLPVNIKIYRIEEDGTLTEMDARVEDGCFVFTTDHFSLYTIVGFDAPEEVQDPELENNNFAVITSAAAIAVAALLIAVWAKKKKR